MDRLDLSPAPHGRDSSRAYFASSSLPRHEERVLALLSANDEPVVQVVRAGNQVLRREGFWPIGHSLPARAKRLDTVVPPEHGNPTPANDDVQSYATDAYERIVGLVEKRVHREGELFESPAAPETAMIWLSGGPEALRRRYAAAVDTVLDVIRDGRLGELIGTLRKFGRIGMPTDERILSHVAAKAPDIDDVWEDGPIATAEQAPMTEHYERRLRQLIGMIPEIWAGVFFGMDITSANHGPDLAWRWPDGKTVHLEIKTGGKAIALPWRQAERFARIPHAYYLLAFHGEAAPWALFRESFDGCEESGGWEDALETAAVRLATSMMGHTRMFLVSAREIRKFYSDLDVKQRTEDRYGGIYGVWKPVSRARCEELAARSSSRTMSLPSADGAGDMCTLTIIGGPTVEKKFLAKSERTGRKTDAPARPTAKRGRSRATHAKPVVVVPGGDCPF